MDSPSPLCHSWYIRLYTKRLSPTSLLQLVQQATVPRDSVSLLLQLVKQAVVPRDSASPLLRPIQRTAVPRDWVSPHCYSWYSKLQYKGTQFHLCYSWYNSLQYQGTHFHLLQLVLPDNDHTGMPVWMWPPVGNFLTNYTVQKLYIILSSSATW
jgi:hypothetical protein